MTLGGMCEREREGEREREREREHGKEEMWRQRDKFERLATVNENTRTSRASNSFGMSSLRLNTQKEQVKA